MIVEMRLAEQIRSGMSHDFYSVQTEQDILNEYISGAEVVLHFPAPDTPDYDFGWVCEEYIPVTSLAFIDGEPWLYLPATIRTTQKGHTLDIDYKYTFDYNGYLHITVGTVK